MNTDDFTDVFLNNETETENENINEINTEIEHYKNNIFNTETNNTYTESTNKITKPKLTKYEKVRIIGERTKLLTLGAKPMVIINDSNLTSYEIALIEYEKNMIPFKIKRYLPNNTYEIWKFSELENY